jgi:hypothetical protein
MPTAFVLMPFAPEFNEIYNLFIAPTLVEAGYNVFRADDIVSQQNILRDIVCAIEDSDLVIADLTNANPNVYYELGIAHAIEKPVVLLVQDIAELPFDLRAYRVVLYSTHFAAIQKAKTDLLALARGAQDGTVSFGSPVSDFRSSTSITRVPIQVAKAPGMDIGNTADQIDLEGEPGFFDYLVDAEEGFATLTAIIVDVGEQIHGMGEDARKTGEEVEAASSNPSSGTARHIQKIARRMAERQEGFAQNLKRANSEYQNTLTTLENAIEGVIRAQEPSSEEDCRSLEDYLDVLRKMEESAFKGRQSLVNMKETMDRVPRMERRLTRAIGIASDEVKRFIDNIDQTLAVVGRARNLGERILRQSNCGQWGTSTEQSDNV